MSKVNKSWMAVVAAVLLLGILVGAVWARPSDRPAAQEATRKLTLTGAAFIPNQNNGWYNNGNYVSCNSGCVLTSPLAFPTLGAVTVERIKLHVNDGNATQYAQATLYRDKPADDVENGLGSATSPSGTSGGLKTYDSGAINKVVWPSQQAYIWLYIGGIDITVNGVTVEYHRNL